MVSLNLTFDPNVSLEQRIGFTLAAALYETLFTDITPINFHIGATHTLDNNKAVGGAVPIFHEVHYGVYQQYWADDVSSESDASALDALQDGNTVDVWIDEQLVEGNTKIMLTRAQAKALGMTEALVLEDGSTWTRDMVQDPDALDGHIVINNSYDWSYDFTREAEAAPNTLDFLTMALHELGHNLGFVSGLDGLMKNFELHSGKTHAEGFTSLDLFRYSDTSANIDHPDGSISDLSVGEAVSFSLDGGKTAIAEFEEGDEYQASHWQRSQNALGIMDPTLGYQERTSLSHLDLQAFDVLGWDIDYDAYQAGLDLNVLYNQTLHSIGDDFGVGVEAIESAIANDQDWHTLIYRSWWQTVEQQMLELGHDSLLQAVEPQMLELWHGSWWQTVEPQMLELGHDSLLQAIEPQMLELGHDSLLQAVEPQMLELWHGSWWQTVEPQMLELWHGSWWQTVEPQMLELWHGSWWQELEPSMNIAQNSILEEAAESPTDGTQHSEENSNFTFTEGKTDGILSGHEGRDLISGDSGDDLSDGAGGDDIILGGKGNDIIYGGHGLDILYGGEDDDFLTGENDADLLYGEGGHDILTGGHGDDTLDGGVGNDELIGDRGSDRLSGGLGNDILNGTDDHVAGAFEQDILIGGGGSDRFILGDTHQSYYLTQGIEDYATVMDFNAHLDVIQLHGSTNSYQQEQHGQDVWLRYENNLIAIFNATASLSLAGPGVEFV